MSQYDTTDEKVADIERYLVRKVDRIHRAVMLALGLAAIAAVTSVWTAVRPGGGDRASDVAQVAPADRGATANESDDAGAERAEADAPAHSATGDRSDAEGVQVTPSGTAAVKDGGEMAAEDARPRSRPAVDPGAARASASEPSADGGASSVDAAPAVPADVTPAPPGAQFTVGASAIATNIVSLEPVGTGTSFRVGTKLFYWTRIETPNLLAVDDTDRFVVHRWIHGGETHHEQKITIGSPRYRVYSMHEPQQPGDWRLEVVDSDGRLLHVEHVTVE